MQPEYEKPYMELPHFAEVYKPCYDYRNMENAGKYRGVGPKFTEGLKDYNGSVAAMPTRPVKSKLRRDHEG